MDLQLPTHTDYTFAPLGVNEALKTLNSRFSEPGFFTPAFSMVEAPTSEVFCEAYDEGVIQVWRMHRVTGGPVGWVILNTWTSLPSIFVYAPDHQGYPCDLTQAALEALIPRIFAADKQQADILTPVTFPEPPEAELMLATLGFETIGCRPEFEAVMTSYWLQRKIYEAYFGGDDSSSSPAP